MSVVRERKLVRKSSLTARGMTADGIKEPGRVLSRDEVEQRFLIEKRHDPQGTRAPSSPPAPVEKEPEKPAGPKHPQIDRFNRRYKL